MVIDTKHTNNTFFIYITVGNTDGKIDDKRYFQTNLHCGIFVKKEDTIKV